MGGGGGGAGFGGLVGVGGAGGSRTVWGGLPLVGVGALPGSRLMEAAAEGVDDASEGGVDDGARAEGAAVVNTEGAAGGGIASPVEAVALGDRFRARPPIASNTTRLPATRARIPSRGILRSRVAAAVACTVLGSTGVMTGSLVSEPT